jgi:chromosome segregation ATPase
VNADCSRSPRCACSVLTFCSAPHGIQREVTNHELKKTELAEMRDNLGSEMAKIQGDAAAGKSSAEEIAADLAKERQALKSKAAEHDSTKAELETLRGEMRSVKESSAESSADLETKLREAAERHAGMLQAAKADAAAEQAELKQRHDDNMQDMKTRLGSFVEIVKPMMATYKEMAAQYRKLRSEVTELAATVEPAVKQVKRDLLKALSEVDTQYKEMLTKYASFSVRKECFLFAAAALHCV